MKDIEWSSLSFGYMPTDYNVRCYYRNGKTIRNAKDLKIGDTITTRFETGEVESKVEHLS